LGLGGDSTGSLVFDHLPSKGVRNSFRLAHYVESENARLDVLVIEPGPDLRHWLGQGVAFVPDLHNVHAVSPDEPRIALSETINTPRGF
jgi:hypothetical protein